MSPEARLAPMFEGVGEDVVVCGHTHHQPDREVLGKRLLNAGQRRHALNAAVRRHGRWVCDELRIEGVTKGSRRPVRPR